MIKKIVCAALMLSILAMSSMGAFAAVNSTTTYNTATDDITVESVVDGVKVGDQLTYLAYEGAEPTDTNIAFIDQVTVESTDANYDSTNETYTITYVTDKDYVGAKILQGGIMNSIAVATPNEDEIEPYTEYCDITVTCGETTVGTAKVVKTTAATEGMYEVACSVVPATVTITGVEDLFWYTTATGFMIPKNLCTGSTLAITVTEMESVANSVIVSKVGNDGDAMLVIANVTGDVKNYGVLIGPGNTPNINMDPADTTGVVIDATNADATASKTSINKYPALVGLGENGSFMIKVAGLGVAAEETYRVMAYAWDGTSDNLVHVSDIVNLTIK